VRLARRITMPTTSSPPQALIERAAALLREGKLVAFPTETVYGLGANGLDEAAVDRIFAVKGRPSTSPLILHVDSTAMARALVTTWDQRAETLAQRFWPGPLTLVLPKRDHVPAKVTAGLPTVGIRMPAHTVALALIRAAGVPIAGPSANRFTELSPTTAEHVRKSLGNQVDLIVDGGSTTVGIESTVLSLAVDSPLILRLGMVSQAQIEAALGAAVQVSTQPVSPQTSHASPGMHARHYSPHTPMVLVQGGRLPHTGRGAYLWYAHPGPAARSLRMPESPAGYAALLYEVMHQVDAEGWDWIAVEEPPDAPEWQAIRDRLQRASQSR
jgi:L-threonylcarbamoyladenylate synthase